MKKLLLLFFLATSIMCLHAQTLFLEENFDYGASANGDITTASSSWVRHSGAQGPAYTPTGLTYSGYKSSGVGGAISFTNGSSGINDGDVNYKFGTITTNGIYYVSFLVNLSSAKSSADYFFHVGQSTIGTNYKGRVSAQSSGAGWVVGLQKNSEAPIQGSTILDFNKTYLVVLKYYYNTAALNDDQVALYLYDSGVPVTEPGTPLVTLGPICPVTTAGDLADIGTVVVRQSSNCPTGVIDGIRVSDSWNFAVVDVPAPPTASFSTKTVNFGNVVIGTPVTDGSVVVTNTGASALNITDVTSSNPKVTVTPTTASIDPAASQKFSITYTPTEEVADAATLIFTSNGTVASDTVKVTGSGAIEPIISIATAREDLDDNFVPDRKGQSMLVSGVVVSPDFTASAKGHNYFIMDGTAGVLLYTTKKLSTQLNIGDSILVKGKVDQYKGVTEFVPIDTVVGDNGSVKILKSGAKVPAPIVISVADLNSEKYEGSLVTVKNLCKNVSSKAWPTEGQNVSMTVGTETDSTTLFIDLDTDIDGTAEPVWPQNITGVISQYSSLATPNNGYELLPRSMADFVSTIPADTTPVVTIAAAREDLDNDFVPDRKGDTLKVSGIVISPDFTLSASGHNYYVSDGKSGILLYSKKKFNTQLSIGDSVLVKGVVDQYNGVVEFVPVDTIVGDKGSIKLLKSGAKTPAPIEITLKDLNSEKYEGCLVTVKHLRKTSQSLAWPVDVATKTTNMTVYAGSDTTTLFIDNDTDIDGSAEPTWPEDITGIATQYDKTAPYSSGYEIAPRSILDFTAVPADTTPVVTIKEARKDLDNDFIPDNLGKTFKVKAVVVSLDFTASAPGNNNYYITDGTAGVLLYAKPKLNKPLSVGDSIIVKGTIAQYKGATEFAAVDTLVGEDGSVQILKTNAKVPNPIEISVSDVNSEKYEGSLVLVKGLYKKSSSPAWPVGGKYANIIVGTATDSTILFIDNDTDIDGTEEPTWPQDIVGVISQYSSAATPNNGYELLPRSTADFARTSSVSNNMNRIPEAYALDQNYPNPFNPTTKISFDLRVNASVTLKIYNILGQEAAVLFNNSSISAGHQTVSFNANNLPSGIYIYKLDVKGVDGSDFSGIKKMMLLK